MRRPQVSPLSPPDPATRVAGYMVPWVLLNVVALGFALAGPGPSWLPFGVAAVGTIVFAAVAVSVPRSRAAGWPAVVVGTAAFLVLYLLGEASQSPLSTDVLGIPPVLWFALYGGRLSVALSVLAGAAVTVAHHTLGDAPGRASAWWGAAVLTAGVALVVAATARRLVREARERTGELRTNETRARREADRLAVVLEGAGEYAIIGGSGEQITFFSAGAERMLGYTAAEIVGHHHPKLFHVPSEVASHAERLGLPVDDDLLVAEARAAGSVTREWTFVRKNRTRLPVELTVTALGDGRERPIEYVGVARDISRERMLARYRETREVVVATLSEVDTPSAIADALAALAEGMGWDIGILWIGEAGELRPAAVWEPGEGRSELEMALADVRMPRGSGMCGTVWRDNESLWVPDLHEFTELTDQTRAIRDGVGHHLRAAVCLPLRARGPDPLGVLQVMALEPRAVDRDVTQLLEAVGSEIALHLERTAAAAELRAARDDAELANRAKDEFLSTISHELRTPLNAVLGFGRLLEEPGAETGTHAKQITRAARHLSALIDDLLDIGRMTRGELVVDCEPVRAATALSQAADLVRPMAEERGIELSTDVHAGLYEHVLADTVRLRQVLLNLLTNAVRHSGTHTTVRLSLSRDDDTVTFVVADTGCGIAPADHTRVFEPLIRLDPGQSEGSGLGLSISRQLAEAMGGTLSLESALNAGTTLRLSLPLASPPSTIEAHPGPPSLPATTVLYIEDDEPSCQLMSTLLAANAGVELVTASTGVSGIDSALSRAPDLILLDSRLPDVSGALVLRRLRGHPATMATPVIIVSAEIDRDQRDAFTAAGADGFVPKPVESDRLLSVINGALNDGPTRPGIPHQPIAPRRSSE